jgi:hypothetical protein
VCDDVGVRLGLLLAVFAACGRTELVDDGPLPQVVPSVEPVDAGPADAGVRDAGRVDAGPVDAGRRDAGTPDAGRDAGFDAGRPEMGLAQDDLIYVHEDRQLFTFTPSTGALSRVTGFSCLFATDMAIDRAGRAFLVANNTLFRVNLQTGTCTGIARLPESLVALAFLPAGVLDQLNETLVGYGETAYWEFDPTDGFASRLGTSALSGDLVPSGDLTALSDGGTFLTVRSRAWPGTRPDELVRIDPLTGAVVEQLGPIGLDEVWGLATFDDALYGFTANGGAARFSFRDGGVLAIPFVLLPGRRFWGAAARPGARSFRDAGP